MPEGSETGTTEELSIGDVIVVHFPEHAPQGHEQEGYRPAIVVGLPEQVDKPRFPILILVPLTTDRNQAWARHSRDLYPRLPKGAANLSMPSICLLDQVRAIGLERIRGFRGSLTGEELVPIHSGLRQMFT